MVVKGFTEEPKSVTLNIFLTKEKETGPDNVLDLDPTELGHSPSFLTFHTITFLYRGKKYKNSNNKMFVCF